MSQTNNSETKYFDLHTTGIGYLNRVREVPVRRGEPFLPSKLPPFMGHRTMSRRFASTAVSRAPRPGRSWPS